MRHADIDFHNVAELRDDGNGLLLQRVPEQVRTQLNDGAQTRMRHPAGVELRFVPDGPVEIELSTVTQPRASESLVRVFWGPIQGYETFVVGPEPTTIELAAPDRLADIGHEHCQTLAYHPRVCRLLLPGEHRGAHVRFHGVEGELRPPRTDEVPERRYLAYGTSITEGEAPVAEHLTYVNQAAMRLGVDPLNFGSCGTAYCDVAMADYIAARDDWDVATLALSVNMVGRFSVDEFRERATYMVETVAGTDPSRPVACITLYRNARDVCRSEDEAHLCEEFRDTLRSVVASSTHDNVYLFEGPELLPDIGGLTTDLVHPGDNAMIRIGESLANKLASIL